MKTIPTPPSNRIVKSNETKIRLKVEPKIKAFKMNSLKIAKRCNELNDVALGVYDAMDLHGLAQPSDEELQNARLMIETLLFEKRQLIKSWADRKRDKKY